MKLNRKYRMSARKIAAIDALIPLAVQHADKLVPEPHSFEVDDRWNRAYHSEMNRLAIEAGLRMERGNAK